MNRRVLFLLLLVVVLGGGAAAFLLLSQQQQGGETPPPDTTPVVVEVLPTPVPVEFVEIVVAIQDLPRGIVIPEDGVALRPWPKEAAPNNAIEGQDGLRSVIGKIARTDIVREAPVLFNQLVEDLGKIGRKGSDAAAVLPTGLVAVAVPVDRLTNVANAPMSGDYVDIILSFLFVDVDEEFQSRLPNRITLTTLKQDGSLEFQTGIEGRVEPSGDFPFPIVVGPSEVQRPRLVTQRTIQTAFVVHVGEFPPDGDFLMRRPTPTPVPTQDPNAEGGPTPPPPPPTPTTPPKDIITLAVEPQDAVVLVWAIESRLPITLALRSANDLNRTATNAVTLEYMLSTYNVPQPPRLPYALEPAIRSIRRLIIGNEFTFGESTK